MCFLVFNIKKESPLRLPKNVLKNNKIIKSRKQQVWGKTK
jgi:hypothetical protein